MTGSDFSTEVDHSQVARREDGGTSDCSPEVDHLDRVKDRGGADLHDVHRADFGSVPVSKSMMWAGSCSKAGGVAEGPKIGATTSSSFFSKAD